MAEHIPAGNGFIAGRSSGTARALLDAADAVGARQQAIRTLRTGYYAPDVVVEQYAATLAEVQDEPREAQVVRHGGGVQLAGEGNAPAEGVDADKTGSPAVAEPAKNASTKTWADFAQEHHGYNSDEDLSRDQLIERYGTSAEAEKE